MTNSLTKRKIPHLTLGIHITIIFLFVVGAILFAQWMTEAQERNALINKPFNEYNNEIKADIKSGKITCDFIKKLIVEKETFSGRHPLEYSDTKTMVRAYWNANSCGFEWNWWD